MSFRGRVFTGSLAYPSDAGRFIAIARNLGGSFTTAQKRALGYLTNGLADLGIGAPGSNWVIYPFIGGSSSAVNALNLFYPTTTAYNLTFVGSPTHSASGVAFNGTTQYAYGQSLSIYPLTPNLTLSNVSIGVGVTGMVPGSFPSPMGSYVSASVQTKVYSTAGSFFFDPNLEAPGFTSFSVSAWGGGGGGGGSNGTTSNRAGGGGAGGGYAASTVTLTGTQLNTTITITIGSAGTVTAGSAGGAGGDTIISHPNITTITAKGGPGGNVNTAGAAGAAVAGAAGNAGTTTFTGGGGAAGGGTVAFGGGGGGSSAGTSTNGNPGSTPTSSTGGAAGTAPGGGVAGGVGGVGVSNGPNAGAGNAGNAGGGGGGGAGSTTSGNNKAGGAGGVGKVTVAWTPTVAKSISFSINNGNGSNTFLAQADNVTSPSSQFAYTTSPILLNGVRVGSRRGNTGTAADMGFYVENNAGSASVGPAVMSTISFSQTPIFYLGGQNSWNPGGAGNTFTAPYSGTINFAFIGPGLSNTQLQSLYTLITTYNRILGR